METQGLIDSLHERGFEAQIFSSAQAIRDRLKSLVSPETVVGFGGSKTLRELEIPAFLESQSVPILDHWKDGLAPEQDMALRLDMGRCDLFMTSVNACTQNGRLVLVDGVGNRVAAAVFGPKAVIHVFGTNKIVKDMHAAYERIRTIAAPKRAASLGCQTPCVETGECQDCRSPMRICRATVVLDYAPFFTPTRVWIIEGAYGF